MEWFVLKFGPYFSKLANKIKPSCILPVILNLKTVRGRGYKTFHAQLSRA